MKLEVGEIRKIGNVETLWLFSTVYETKAGLQTAIPKFSLVVIIDINHEKYPFVKVISTLGVGFVDGEKLFKHSAPVWGFVS